MIFTILFLSTIFLCLNANKIQLNNCNCGDFIKISSFSEKNNLKIDKQPFEALFDHPDVKNRRIYLIGNFGETQVLDRIILKELYTNYDSLKDPECRGPIAKSCIEENTKFFSLNSIELWNDVFLYDAMNGSKIAIIFINFKTLEGQSEFKSRQLSAISSFLSSIYLFMGEKSFYDEQFGEESQECDFNFHIDENDQRDEIDGSVLEVRSVLASQNLDMHESLHFIEEDLSVESFMRNLELAERQIASDCERFKEIIEDFIKNFSDGIKNDEKLIYGLLTNMSKVHHDKNFFQNIHTTPKMERKIKLFMKKLTKISNLIEKKSQKFIENSLNLNHDNFQYKSDFLNFSLPIDINIRTGEKRNFIKTLQEIFAIANSEIYKSKTFIKLLNDQKISIPLACDIKC